MKTKLLLMTFMLATQAFANVAEVAQGEINDIHSFVDNLENTFFEMPQTRMALDLSDYQEVRALFIERITRATSDFKQCTLDIATHIAEEVGAMDQEIADLRLENEQRGSRVIGNLIHDRVEARELFIKELKSSAGISYRSCLSKFFKLNNALELYIGVGPKDSARKMRALHLIPLFGTFSAEMFAMDNVGRISFTGEVNTRFSTGSDRIRHRALRNNLRNGNFLLSKCEGHLCRYLFAEDLIAWIEKVTLLNKNLTLFNDFKLKALDLRFNRRRYLRKVKRAVHKMVDASERF